MKTKVLSVMACVFEVMEVCDKDLRLVVCQEAHVTIYNLSHTVQSCIAACGYY